MRPVEIADADRAAVPRRRLDGLELPRHARGRRRAARRPRPASTARAARPAGPRDGRELGALGAERALTGPVARGDEATVARQRAAIAERAPELLELFDALAAAHAARSPSGVRASPRCSA